jgi:hypothetical protein
MISEKDHPAGAHEQILKIYSQKWQGLITDQEGHAQMYRVLIDLWIQGKKDGVTQKVQDCLDTLSDIAVNLDELNSNMDELAGQITPWASH